jgi:hypothetical protein
MADSHFGAQAGLAAVAVLALGGFAYLPFTPAIGSYIEHAHVGDEVGVSASVIGVGGLLITLWQLLQTRRASAAATEAVAALQLRVSSYENSTLCETCLAAAVEIDKANTLAIQAPSKDTYLPLVERYRELRLSLVKLRERLHLSLDDKDKLVFTIAVTKLQDAQRTVPTALARATLGSYPNLRPLQAAMQEITEVRLTRFPGQYVKLLSAATTRVVPG